MSKIGNLILENGAPQIEDVDSQTETASQVLIHARPKGRKEIDMRQTEPIHAIALQAG